VPAGRVMDSRSRLFGSNRRYGGWRSRLGGRCGISSRLLGDRRLRRGQIGLRFRRWIRRHTSGSNSGLRGRRNHCGIVAVADWHRSNGRPFVDSPWWAHPCDANGAVTLTYFAKAFPACRLERARLSALVCSFLADFLHGRCIRQRFFGSWCGRNEFPGGQRVRRRERHRIHGIGLGR
jgi:hypothetical protein